MACLIKWQSYQNAHKFIYVFVFWKHVIKEFRSVSVPIFICTSLFQALDSWGRGEKSERKKRRRTKTFLALVLRHFFSRSPFFFLFVPNYREPGTGYIGSDLIFYGVRYKFFLVLLYSHFRSISVNNFHDLSIAHDLSPGFS